MARPVMIRGFSHRIVPLLLAVLCWVGPHSRGEPAVSGQQAPRDRPCVLLNNGNVLFGTAQQRGDFVVVKKQDGSQLQLNRKDVACWASSPHGLYRYRVDHRRSHGVLAHLQEARWCMRYDLYDLATKEIQAVYRIDPNNRSADQLVQQLLRLGRSKTATAIDPTKPITDGTVQLASHDERLPPGQETDAAALQRFARHVQPLLLNRCGNCHSADSDREWKLLSPALGSRPSARITQANLSATTPYVDINHPLQSELRVRAVDGHAGKLQSLGPLAAKPTRTLDAWLHSIKSSSQPTAVSQAFGTNGASDPLPEDDHVKPADHLQPPANGPPGITRLPAVTNPFDPAIFNRRFHRDQAAKAASVTEAK